MSASVPDRPRPGWVKASTGDEKIDQLASDAAVHIYTNGQNRGDIKREVWRRLTQLRDFLGQFDRFPKKETVMNITRDEDEMDAKLKMTEADIREECQAVADLLCKKNAAYGDSSLIQGSPDGEDVEQDLIGYLILMRIHRKRTARRKQMESAGSRPEPPGREQPTRPKFTDLPSEIAD